MFEEILEAFLENPDNVENEVPRPIRETGFITRLPAYQDDRQTWQGATIIQQDETRYIVRFDDGRVNMTTTPREAWEFYAANADCWM